MKILIVSDLHFEFHRDEGKAMFDWLAPADVVVLAGDIATPPIATKILTQFCTRYPHVVFVEGNHEFYGSSPTEVHKQFGTIAASHANFHWLNDSAVMIDGQRFIGATLWFSRFPGWERRQALMNDFHLIKGLDPWVFEQNAKSQAFLAENVQPTDIVVTHYLPSQQSVDEQWRDSPLNGFFVCDIEGTIRAKQPRVWIHGHTHSSCRYKIGETEVICNPFGYAAREENGKFNPALMIDR